jgi:3-methyl-2-oxobutanoate hydroxymethyltransferase
MARLFDAAGIDVILVGDSLGMVVQGHENTLPVTLDEVIYHCKCVRRGVTRAFVVGDMPFMSYQVNAEQGLRAAGRLIQEGGVSAVKLEGGVFVAETIARIVNADIPVMGHVGLTPQSVHRMGGYKVQGRSKDTKKVDIHAPGTRQRVIQDARAVAEAGAFAVVLEGVPSELAQEITELLPIPTIGIGAGPSCDGQILVSTDLLGCNPDFLPTFAKRYANLSNEISGAVRSYIDDVQKRNFPGPEHSFGVRRSHPKIVGV